MFKKLRIAASIVGIALLCVMILFTLTAGTAQAAVASPTSYTTAAAPANWHPPFRCYPPDWYRQHRRWPPPRFCAPPPPPHYHKWR